MVNNKQISVKLFFIFVGIIISLSNCSKEKAGCWDVYTSNGSMTQTLCGKTEEEIRNVYGIYYDKANAAKFCWQSVYPGYFIYSENLSEKMAGIFFADATSYNKVVCGFCQKWEYYIKSVYKPTGENFNAVPKVQFLCGDTCTTLFPGREIVIRETADSIISTVFKYKL